MTADPQRWGLSSQGEAGVIPRWQGLCLEWSSAHQSTRTVRSPTSWDPWPKLCRAEGKHETSPASSRGLHSRGQGTVRYRKAASV